MIYKRCLFCRKKFTKTPQVRNQSYCSEPECQRHRRRQWQKTKREGDPDYKDNQARAQQAWMKKNSSYWSKYRRSHPAYQAKNRRAQLERNAKRKSRLIAKMDERTSGIQLPAGVYRLIPVSVPGIAKMDAWMVEIRLLSQH